MASVWIRTRRMKDGGKRYRVEFRIGGREARIRYGASFTSKRDDPRRLDLRRARGAARPRPHSPSGADRGADAP
jgi:hypothetical protein